MVDPDFIRLPDGTMRRVKDSRVVEKAPPPTETHRQRQVRLQEEENGYQLTLRGRKKCDWEQDDHLEY
jgi:hypothetical protein